MVDAESVRVTQWSKELPTVAGFYWFRSEEKNKTPTIVEAYCFLNDSPEPPDAFYFLSNEGSFKCHELKGSLWMGPIAPPSVE